MEKRKVLVVDDEPDICDSFRELLTHRGCEVFTALKSEDAWEIFQRERPQACSIDIHMTYSAYDGLELLRRIREIDQKTYCIVFTVEEEKAMQEKAAQLGADQYRPKPASAQELRELVDDLCAKTRRS